MLRGEEGGKTMLVDFGFERRLLAIGISVVYDCKDARQESWGRILFTLNAL